MKDRNIDLREYINYYSNHTTSELENLRHKQNKTQLESKVEYFRGILAGSYSVLREVFRDDNVDTQKLEYKDQEKTKQEDRLLLLFFLNNGIIDTKLMNEYDIPLIYLSILSKKWEITPLIRGIYSLDKLGTYWQQELKNNPTLIYAIYEKDKITVSRTDRFKRRNQIYRVFISKKYQGKIPEGANIKIIAVDDDKIDLYRAPRRINSNLTFYEYLPIRNFCEQVKRMSKMFHDNIVDFIESEEFDYLYSLYKDLKFTRVTKTELIKASVRLGIEEATFVYDFLDKYYKRK